MSKELHILGNGDMAHLFKKQERKGTLLLCNMPPFHVEPKRVYATVMVDFKMMAALTEGQFALDQYQWILGTRPRIWMYERSAFYMKYAPNIREFYTYVPDYAVNPTNFNCGHMAAHYAAAKHKPDVINIYGFDTMFDFNMRSYTDTVLSSDRTDTNNYRLLNIWRPIMRDIIREFPQTEFVFHHNHDNLKIPRLDNCRVEVYDGGLSSMQMKEDTSDLSHETEILNKMSPEEKKVTSKEIPLNRKQRRMMESFARRGFKDHEF